MKDFNNLPEKLKLQKEVIELAAKIGGNDYPVNFVINTATKKIFDFNGKKVIKDGNEFAIYSFLGDKDFLGLKEYPLKQLFNFQ